MLDAIRILTFYISIILVRFDQEGGIRAIFLVEVRLGEMNGLVNIIFVFIYNSDGKLQFVLSVGLNPIRHRYRHRRTRYIPAQSSGRYTRYYIFTKFEELFVLLMLPRMIYWFLNGE